MTATLEDGMDRANAKIGLYITLNRPTHPMTREADIYVTEHYLSVEMLTIKVIRNGSLVEYSRFDPEATLSRTPILHLSHPVPSHLTAKIVVDITAIGRTRSPFGHLSLSH